MLLSFAVIVLIAAIAFFHYVQGLFSATLSAILTIVAAVLAFSFHEPLVDLLLGGRFTDQAYAMVLVALFAVIYLVLRLIFDSLVPGNIRLPVLVDKIGAAVMGVVAGLFAVGTLLIATQLLPFGPSIAGYARYEVVSKRQVVVPGQRRSLDAQVFQELREHPSGQFEPRFGQSLLIPADDLVIKMVQHLSDGGSLAGPVNLTQVHPNFLDQAFGKRLGLEAGARQIVHDPEGRLVRVTELAALPAVRQVEGEIKTIRDRPLPAQVKAPPGQMLLAVRLQLDSTVGDAEGGNLVRFGPANIRLVAGGTNYHPIGTLDAAMTMYAHTLDDFILANPTLGPVDLVFLVDESTVVRQEGAERTLRPGVFLVFKHAARVDLSGKQVPTRALSVVAQSGILRKQGLAKPGSPEQTAEASVPGRAVGSPSAAGMRSIVEFARMEVTSRLPSPINVGSFEGDASVTFPGGQAKLRQQKFERLWVDPQQTVGLLSRGDWLIGEFFVPAGRTMVQILATPPQVAGVDAWAWADELPRFTLLDGDGRRHPPHGALVQIKQRQQDYLLARYDAAVPVSDLPRHEGRPTDLRFLYLLPSGQTVLSFDHGTATLRPIHQRIH